MYRIVEGDNQGLADVDKFVALLSGLDTDSGSAAYGLFEPAREIYVARAPGRLDVMGGIADYSGSLVLQLPTRQATLVALQCSHDRRLKIVSLGARGAGYRNVEFEMSLNEFEPGGSASRYTDAHEFFRSDPGSSWAAYVAGAFLVLMRERGVTFREGVRILVSSDVPEGKGVSSSAALEVSTMQALTAAFNIVLEPRETALLCQKVENLVVGAPCGVMDQMTAACGEKDRLLALLCQPAELQGFVRIPDEIAFWGLDSGERHSVAGADYGSVRTGAFMGYRIIADIAGLDVQSAGAGKPLRLSDPYWRGYLANISPSEFEQFYSNRLPLEIHGGEFIKKYAGITDTVTRVDASRNYAVRNPTAHPVYEHFRVRTFAELLGNARTEQTLELLGELMYQSHASYSACGLGSEGTDLLVRLVREAGAARGLYGAKITGGGSGGTVAVLGRSGSDGAVAEIADEYERRKRYKPVLFTGSSPGACAFGVLKLVKDG